MNSKFGGVHHSVIRWFEITVKKPKLISGQIDDRRIEAGNDRDHCIE